MDTSGDTTNVSDPSLPSRDSVQGMLTDATNAAAAATTATVGMTSPSDNLLASVPSSSAVTSSSSPSSTLKQEDRKFDSNRKPPYSYIALITMAIEDSPRG